MALHVEVVTPRGAALSADADEVVAPGVLGEFGVLPGHLPLLSGLRPGVLRLRHGGKQELVAVGAGFVQVGARDHVIVLTETCEKSAQVDVEVARRDLAAADEKLRAWSRETGAEFQRAVLDRAWAEARIKVSESRRA
ncbi:MAG: ATP synthase F1 subunit epsilon [Myxococcota bacterium]